MVLGSLIKSFAGDSQALFEGKLQSYARASANMHAVGNMPGGVQAVGNMPGGVQIANTPNAVCMHMANTPNAVHVEPAFPNLYSNVNIDVKSRCNLDVRSDEMVLVVALLAIIVGPAWQRIRYWMPDLSVDRLGEMTTAMVGGTNDTTGGGDGIATWSAILVIVIFFYIRTARMSRSIEALMDLVLDRKDIIGCVRSDPSIKSDDWVKLQFEQEVLQSGPHSVWCMDGRLYLPPGCYRLIGGSVTLLNGHRAAAYVNGHCIAESIGNHQQHQVLRTLPLCGSFFQVGQGGGFLDLQVKGGFRSGILSSLPPGHQINGREIPVAFIHLEQLLRF
ncbi:unnamed protein product [Effrenium voratum]|uniref:Uncharacterized protein n=1 Tax=Effrenium voratum TaxID=2562239 RepID=A0AA36NA09_9DINO|nr:unnamed protein product [Effrenium voratum]CAJ1441277.1 unnamed protein product [Effrenium voratum]CAJ1453893.1 unnamed protein product [Effrenium voratum]